MERKSGRWVGPDRGSVTTGRTRWFAGVAAVGAVLLLAFSVLTYPGPGTASLSPPLSSARSDATSGPSPATSSLVTNTTLSVGGLVGNLSPEFWGTTVSNEVHLLRGESDAVNATPVRVLVWPGAMAGEDYDPLTNTHYNTYDGVPTPAPTTEPQFIATCRAIHCVSIFQLPAEIDNASYAEKIVNYTEGNLSFTPSYWMLGNEPELWQHWKVPWTKWGTQYTTGPNPTQFGDEVLAYVAKIRAVDPTTPILGLPASGCTCGAYTFAQWISGVLAVTGSKIQAVAFHEYPAGWLGTGDGSLLDFYKTLRSSVNITTRVAAARASVASACPGCNVSVFISELGSALSWSTYGPYAAGFSGSLSIAAQVTQALDVNLTNLDLFATELETTNSWFGTSGTPRPDYGLYAEVLPHLGTAVHPVNFTGLGGSMYGIATVDPEDAGRQDLLVVNTNLTQSAEFAPAFADGSPSSSIEALYWNGSIHTTASNHTTWVEPYTASAVSQEYAGLPAAYDLPPQSLVLFESYPAGGTYVRVGEDGVPANSTWYATLGNRFFGTSGNNVTLLLPPGNYPVGGVPISLPVGGTEKNPSERLAPFAPSPLVVAGSSTNATLTFVPQWRVNVSASPLTGGTAGPDVGWWNASEPLALSAEPAPGQTFDRWSGWGPGSYNGSWPSITIRPTGRVNETAHFETGVPGTFFADNLPAGAAWSVTVRNLTTDSSAGSLVVYAPTGTWAYHIAPPAGFRVAPQNGSFFAPGVTYVHFFPITPPALQFPVTFETTGLPGATSVAITVRTVTETILASGPTFHLTNGTYAYQVGYVPGYHAEAPLKLFNVTGGPLTVVVPFAPTTYLATWEAQGVRAGLAWSLQVDGVSVNATSAWASLSLVNGSHRYTVQVPANYSASPRNGMFSVGGGPMVVSLAFQLVLFPLRFEVAGSGAPAGWSVRLGDVTQGATPNGSNFEVANGTYTFDVHPPVGYYATPSHGNLTVAGALPAIELRFLPVSEKPSPALVAALTSGAFVVSAWMVLAVLAGFFGVRLLRRRRG